MKLIIDEIIKYKKDSIILLRRHPNDNSNKSHVLEAAEEAKIKKNIFIIEDSAHAFCGEYNNKIIGYYSDFLVFSFYATKSITCGEGGAIITNQTKYIDKIRSLSNNGMTKPAFKRYENNNYKPWDVTSFGFKANLSDINASLLKSQIIEYSKTAQKKRKKLFVFSGVLVEFRTQGNGRFGSPNWNFPFQFSHQKQILAPKYPILSECGLLLSELKHLQVSNAFKNLRNVFVTQFWIDIDFYFFCISRNYR